MGSQERFLPVEPKVIYPDIHEEARIMFSKYWSVGNAFLDQLVYEILVKYRYDKPLTVLSIFTASPIRIIRRPNGTSYAEYPVRFDGEEKSGNCHALCCKMLLDSDFRQWLVELEEQTGCRISTYFTEGNSPSYFVSKKMNHFWLMLYHGRTGTNLLVDPSFQRVSRGKGYRFETNDNQLIDRESQIPRGGSSHIELANYKTDQNGSITIPSQIVGLTILGITPQEKVLSYGFACGQTNFEPTIPLAGLISPHGETEIYYFDPQVGVVRTSTKTPPHEADRIVLTSFFEIAANFEFRRGQY